MEERYIKAIDTDIWIRPAGWPALPTLTTADDKYAGVYAIYEGKTNRLALSHNSVAASNTIDWGDGTSVTWTGNAFQVKTWDYSTISAPVLVDDAGYNYKPVLIQYQLNSGTPGPLQLSNTIAAIGAVVQSNWLDLLMSWPAGFLFAQRPRLMQRLNLLKGPGNQNLSSAYTGLFGLRVFEGNMFGPGNTNQYTSIQTSLVSIGPARLGNLEVNKTGSVINGSGMFSSGFIKSVGDINFTNVNITTMFNACRDLETVGNITARETTSITNLVSGCTNLERIGIIDIGTGTASVSGNDAFNACVNLREIEFISPNGATRLSTTTGMFTSCNKLRRLRLPGMSVTFSIFEADLERAELVQLFNDLATVVVTQTITITGNPGVATLTAGELLIATSKNWTVFQ